MRTYSGPGSAARQAAALRQEGVRVDADSMGDYYVDFARYGWFPDRLPSEEGEGELSSDDDDNDDEVDVDEREASNGDQNGEEIVRTAR